MLSILVGKNSISHLPYLHFIKLLEVHQKYLSVNFFRFLGEFLSFFSQLCNLNSKLKLPSSGSNLKLSRPVALPLLCVHIAPVFSTFHPVCIHCFCIILSHWSWDSQRQGWWFIDPYIPVPCTMWIFTKYLNVLVSEKMKKLLAESFPVIVLY